MHDELYDSLDTKGGEKKMRVVEFLTKQFNMIFDSKKTPEGWRTTIEKVLTCA